MERDLIIVVYGGGMVGVFGAGVVTAFQNTNLYPRVHSVYGISSGSHNLAYFLAEDTQKGSSIYYENLCKNFIFPKRLPVFLIQFFLKLFSKKIKTARLMDTDFLIDVEKNKKILNLQKIKNSPINFWVKLFDVAEGKNVYTDGKVNTFEKLRAAAGAIPYYNNLIEIEGKEYADSSVLSDWADETLMSLVEKNRDKKIICVRNTSLESALSYKSIFGNLLWAAWIGIYFGKFSLFLQKANYLKKYKNLKKLIIENKNVYYIESNMSVPLYCCDPKKLLELYYHGIEKGERLLNQLDTVLVSD